MNTVRSGMERTPGFMIPHHVDSCLTLQLHLNRELLRREEVVEMRLSLRNVCDHRAEVYFNGRPPYDFVARLASGTEIWRWSHGKVIETILEHRLMDPGEVVEFTASWDQRNSQGEVATPGTYEVIGVLKGDPPDVLVTLTKTVKITANGTALYSARGQPVHRRET